MLPSQPETEKGAPRETRDKILLERLPGWSVIGGLELLVFNVCITEQLEAESGWHFLFSPSFHTKTLFLFDPHATWGETK